MKTLLALLVLALALPCMAQETTPLNLEELKIGQWGKLPAKSSFIMLGEVSSNEVLVKDRPGDLPGRTKSMEVVFYVPSKQAKFGEAKYDKLILDRYWFVFEVKTLDNKKEVFVLKPFKK